MAKKIAIKDKIEPTAAVIGKEKLKPAKASPGGKRGAAAKAPAKKAAPAAKAAPRPKKAKAPSRRAPSKLPKKITPRLEPPKSPAPDDRLPVPSLAPHVSPVLPESKAPANLISSAMTPARPEPPAPAAVSLAIPPSAAKESQTVAAPSFVAAKKKITLTPQVTVKDLAQLLGAGVPDIIKKLMSLGIWATINQRIERDAAGIIASELGYEVEIPKVFETNDDALAPRLSAEQVAVSVSRAPIVTVMGHVDHGKTTLLDAIRQTRVAESEVGGITQHIGAYKVSTHRGEIVFLDTPGHEAFTAMRARGAKATDLVVLVVAADDRVMPQTIEAIDHAKAAGVLIIVAINKVDKPEANVNRVMQELSDLGLTPEAWGGKTIMVEVSAKKKLNIDKLLEMIILEAELLELKSNPERAGVGIILEARKDPKKGTVASVLVTDGTLKVGDPFICGMTWGKVRAMIDDHGVKHLKVQAAAPVVVLGFEEVPQAGDRMTVVRDERQAREIAGGRAAEHEAIHGKGASKHLTLEDLYKDIEKGLVKEFRIVLKGDTQGSLEAIIGELSKLRHEEVVIKVLHQGIGDVSLSDVLLAAASNAVIIGFHVAVDSRAEDEGKRESVEIRPYAIIYELIEDIRSALEGLLTPVIKEKPLGAAEVRAAFRITGSGPVAGCYVAEGTLTRGAQARVMRGGKVIIQGKITGLKRFKEDVSQVGRDFECGVQVSGYNSPTKGDRIECYELVKELKKLIKKT